MGRRIIFYSPEWITMNNRLIRAKANEYRGKLIRNATTAENKLNEVFLNSSLKNRFKFQHIIYVKKPGTRSIERFFIADFFFPESRLIIELDGGYHHDPDQSKKDIERTRILKALGYTVLRMDNDKVLYSKYFDSLIDELTHRLDEIKGKKRYLQGYQKKG